MITAVKTLPPRPTPVYTAPKEILEEYLNGQRAAALCSATTAAAAAESDRGSYPKTMSSPYLVGSLSSGKSPWWGCEPEPSGGDGCLLVQEDGRSSSEGGGYSASELPSNTMPTGHDWGSPLLEGEQERRVVGSIPSCHPKVTPWTGGRFIMGPHGKTRKDNSVECGRKLQPIEWIDTNITMSSA